MATAITYKMINRDGGKGNYLGDYPTEKCPRPRRGEMFKWLQAHSGHLIRVDFEIVKTPDARFERYWLYCMDCGRKDHFEFFD